MSDPDKRFKTHTGLHVTDPRHLASDPPDQPARKRGRPSTYTTELAERVLEQIAEGRFLVDITKGPGLPTWRTIYRWADARSDFRQDLARAHEDGAHALCEPRGLLPVISLDWRVLFPVESSHPLNSSSY